jgi:hypothetical protein
MVDHRRIGLKKKRKEWVSLKQKLDQGLADKNDQKLFAKALSECSNRVSKILMDNGFPGVKRKSVSSFATRYFGTFDIFLDYILFSSPNEVISKIKRSSESIKNDIHEKKLQDYYSFTPFERSMTKNKQLMKSGYIYIITNPAFPEWVKVGKTVDLDRRLGNYQTNDPFQKYSYAYHRVADDRNSAEKILLNELKALGLEQKSEWFKVDLLTVKLLIDRICV